MRFLKPPQVSLYERQTKYMNLKLLHIYNKIREKENYLLNRKKKFFWKFMMKELMNFSKHPAQEKGKPELSPISQIIFMNIMIWLYYRQCLNPEELIQPVSVQ